MDEKIAQWLNRLGPGQNEPMCQFLAARNVTIMPTEAMIDIQQFEGRIRARASSVNKIGELIEKHPEKALAILRTWIYQDT